MYGFQLRAGSSGSGGPSEPYPVTELLTLLAAFTFAQPSAQGLQRCLRAWSAFVAQATLEKGEGSAGDVEKSAALARDNAGGLQSVCQALLEKTLFITNGEALEDLDDDAGSDDNNNGTDWVAAEDGDEGGGGHHHGGGIGGLSELEEFIGEVRAVLLSSSRVPGVGSALSESVLGAFATVLDHLDKTSTSSDGG
ncbi:unnamed protein product [Ectocarpus sp. CCAP 1310/34]|nr:unnamed protein product [Ectocarpus sp. CCAP 1310/34]